MVVYLETFRALSVARGHSRNKCSEQNKDWIYEHHKFSERQIWSNKDEQNLEEKSAIALHAIKTGHTVAFENVQPVVSSK